MNDESQTPLSRKTIQCTGCQRVLVTGERYISTTHGERCAACVESSTFHIYTVGSNELVGAAATLDEAQDQMFKFLFLNPSVMVWTYDDGDNSVYIGSTH